MRGRGLSGQTAVGYIESDEKPNMIEKVYDILIEDVNAATLLLYD